MIDAFFRTGATRTTKPSFPFPRYSLSASSRFFIPFTQLIQMIAIMIRLFLWVNIRHIGFYLPLFLCPASVGC